MLRMSASSRVRVLAVALSFGQKGHFDEKQDPDPHQTEKSDPDSHQSSKMDPNPHLS